MPAISVKRPKEKPETGKKLLVIPFIYVMASRTTIQPTQKTYKQKGEEISYIN